MEQKLGENEMVPEHFMFTASGHSFMVSNPPPPPLSHNPQGGHSEESLAGLELGSVVKVSGVLTGMVGGAS
jgi:hypothetical protein